MPNFWEFVNVYLLSYLLFVLITLNVIILPKHFSFMLMTMQSLDFYLHIDFTIPKTLLLPN